MKIIGTTKFGFRIRTRHGLLLDRLAIHGRDANEATRKLERMYPHCQVLECTPRLSGRTAPEASFGDVVALVTK